MSDESRATDSALGIGAAFAQSVRRWPFAIRGEAVEFALRRPRLKPRPKGRGVRSVGRSTDSQSGIGDTLCWCKYHIWGIFGAGWRTGATCLTRQCTFRRVADHQDLTRVEHGQYLNQARTQENKATWCVPSSNCAGEAGQYCAFEARFPNRTETTGIGISA